MTGMPHSVAVLGAGVVGLSTALTLQHAGFQVALFDKAEPGKGASFGNAGIFADYARLPMASFSNLIAMPGMLLDPESSLSIRRSHVAKMVPWGLHFTKATLPSNYKRAGDALTQLSERAQTADVRLWELAGAQDLIGANGCLALYGGDGGPGKGLAAQLNERQHRGVALEFLDRNAVHDLEPDLLPFYGGGVLYRLTRFAKSPYELCCRLFSKFISSGGQFRHAEVRHIEVSESHAAVVYGQAKDTFDAVVLAAGVASRDIAQQLGLDMPVVSERGYHLMVDVSQRQISRPVVWLDKSVFLTPMSQGIRVAGTAEFANPDDSPSATRSALMLRIARTMIGEETHQRSEWVGSRPSTPDSLPVIGFSKGNRRVICAFGHGHLGLSLSAVTGELVCQLLHGAVEDTLLQALSPHRFSQ